jgi:CheY-like chemotaxis protein
MSRILLVDDSTQAQRLGERILVAEGFEVVTVSTADSALIRLDDVDPDVVVADTVMPGRTGYDICHYLKLSPRHRHVRVILTAGVLDALDEAEIQRAGADGTLRKPFEASALVAAVKSLADAVAAEQAQRAQPGAPPAPAVLPQAQAPAKTEPIVAVLDAEQVRAAVTIALDAAMGNMVDEITRRVLVTLTAKRPQARAAAEQASGAAVDPPEIPPERPQERAKPSKPVESPAPAPSPEALVTDAGTVRRVTPMRVRSGSILGLDLAPVETEKKESSPRR